MAAASLVRVYCATLHDGRQVAVAVLYPGIERPVRSDLRVLTSLPWPDSRVGGYPLGPMLASSMKRALAQGVNPGLLGCSAR